MSSEKVREFHEKFGFPIGTNCLGGSKVHGLIALSLISGSLRSVAECAKPFSDHPLIPRVQLIAEELRELIDAAIAEDEVAFADALADLSYVVTGTAVAFGMPLEQLVEEVHRSNMTKDVGTGFKPTKGKDYSPPDIEAVLWRHKKS